MTLVDEEVEAGESGGKEGGGVRPEVKPKKRGGEELSEQEIRLLQQLAQAERAGYERGRRERGDATGSV